MDSQGTPGCPNHLTPAECLALNPLRIWYLRHHDLFTVQELSRLHFLRWLAQQRRWGGIEDGSECAPASEQLEPAA